MYIKRLTLLENNNETLTENIDVNIPFMGYIKKSKLNYNKMYVLKKKKFTFNFTNTIVIHWLCTG